jgi:hypothetical protein
MSKNDPPKNKSNDPSGSGEFAPLSEAEVDGALTRASGLADGLRKELDASAGQERHVMSEPTSEADVATGLTRRLEELDTLLSETQSELGIGDSTPAPAKKAAPAGGYVPDFMAEFTEPASSSAEPSTGLVPAVANRGAAANTAGGLGDDLLQAPASTEQSTSRKRASREGAPPDGKPRAAQTAAENSVSQTDRRKDGPRSVPMPRADADDKTANMGMALLDAINRPFQRVAPAARQILGWLAILMIAAAGVVFAMSRF